MSVIRPACCPNCEAPETDLVEIARVEGDGTEMYPYDAAIYTCGRCGQECTSTPASEARVTLVAFVTARLAEAEAIARTAGEDHPEWEHGGDYALRIQTVDTEGSLGYESHIAITHDYEGLTDSVSDYAAPHIALWDPAMVLRLVAAHRSIVENYEMCKRNGYGTSWAFVPLAAIATLWPAHPDYDPDWDPS